MRKRLAIVGGGASGLLCGILAAENGMEVTIYEKNEKVGKKLFITGKGRCNLTNACDTEELFHNVVSNPKFLYSAFYGFDNSAVMNLFERLGVRLKVERGNRVFPQSDHSSDVLKALQMELKRQGVKVRLQADVTSISYDAAKEIFQFFVGKEKQEAELLVIATGGNSYPLTGSTGDGYQFASELGHQVTKLYPALVPLRCREDYVKKLQGLSLKNVKIKIDDEKRELFSDFGEMLFTHYGVSGPLILSASSYLTKQIEKGELRLHIDLKPALSIEQLDLRLLREFESNRNKSFKNILPSLFPAKLIPVMLERSGIDENKKIHEITKEERLSFLDLIKDFSLTITDTQGFSEAIITQGGVKVKDINPSTMESKKIKNLYFIGEVLDLDALTGGFNLQIAWSTAAMAAFHMGKGDEENEL